VKNRGGKMPSPKLLSADMFLKAEEDFKNLKEGIVAKKLLAIINYSRLSSLELSKIFKVSPKTILNWIKKYKEEGIEGLKEKRGGNYPPKLQADIWEEFLSYVIKGKDFDGKEINWTLKKMVKALESQYGIKISEEGVRLRLKKSNIVLRRPRRRHYKANHAAQESFKKND
jgi:transposase